MLFNPNDFPDKYTDEDTNSALVDILASYNSSRILELGSGVTTAILASFKPEHLVSISLEEERLYKAELVLSANEMDFPDLIHVKEASANIDCCTRVPLFRFEMSDLLPIDQKFNMLFVNLGKKQIGGILLNLEPYLEKGCIIAVNDFGDEIIKRSISLWERLLKKRKVRRTLSRIKLFPTPRKISVMMLS